MQIVIDIDENVYTRLFDNGRPMDIADGIVINRVIRNGTPLPKGHGRLIDADALIKDIRNNDGYEGYEKVEFCYELDWASTVLEADKENKDADSN